MNILLIYCSYNAVNSFVDDKVWYYDRIILAPFKCKDGWEANTIILQVWVYAHPNNVYNFIKRINRDKLIIYPQGDIRVCLSLLSVKKIPFYMLLIDRPVRKQHLINVPQWNYNSIIKYLVIVSCIVRFMFEQTLENLILK